MASTSPAADQVRESYVRLYQPLPASIGAHPAECDWIGYLRFRAAAGPADSSLADAVLVGMPGNLAGAGHLEVIADNVILNAASEGRHIEFWALDRRSNCLEDHTGLDAAEAQGDYQIALNYYFYNHALNGRRFTGFPTSAQLPWLANLDLAQTVRDEYAVIAEGIPDPVVRAKRVFCGGHSQGGLITGAFADWDFAGVPGWQQCAGYFALETEVAVTATGLGSTTGFATPVTSATYPGVVALLQAGVLPRIETSGPPLTPENTLILTLVAQAADQAPNTETDLLKRLPHDQDIDLTLRLLFSRDAAAFATGQPSVRDFRMTNSAAFGALVDDNSQALGFVAASVGVFDGGAVAEKDFPTPSALVQANPLLGWLPTNLILTNDSLMIPTQVGPLYTWRNYNEVATAPSAKQLDEKGQPFSTPAEEVTDIHQWAHASSHSPADLTEWYMPTRIVLDNLAAAAGARSGDLAGIRYLDGTTRHPTITCLGGESLAPSVGLDPTLSRAPNRLIILPGYHHADVTSAARLQNDGRPEQCSQALTDFVLSNAPAASQRDVQGEGILAAALPNTAAPGPPVLVAALAAASSAFVRRRRRGRRRI